MNLRAAVAVVGTVVILAGCSSGGASELARGDGRELAVSGGQPAARPVHPPAQPRARAPAAIKATPGQSVKMMLLPKFLGILPFDQANKGAMEAEAELKNPEKLAFVGPTAGKQRPGPDRVHDQRAHPGHEGRDDVQQRR